MVVEPRQDLDIGPISETPVREIGLPHLVGQLGLEPQVRRPRSLPRLRRHQPGGHETTPDRRDRHRDAVVAFEVPSDRVGTGVETVSGELDP